MYFLRDGQSILKSLQMRKIWSKPLKKEFWENCFSYDNFPQIVSYQNQWKWSPEIWGKTWPHSTCLGCTAFQRPEFRTLCYIYVRKVRSQNELLYSIFSYILCSYLRQRKRCMTHGTYVSPYYRFKPLLQLWHCAYAHA